MSRVTSTLLTLLVTLTAANADCTDGWSSCDSSIWVSPKIAADNPLTWSYTPGEIRGPLEYEIKFSCRGRRNGYYADLDHGCKVWHYCNTTREVNAINGLSTWTYMHFSYACLEQGQRYDQVLKECVYESKALTRCVDSELYYPSGDNPNDVPVTVSANNRLVPVRCPQTPVQCQVQNDHIAMKGCPEAPGAVVSFYATLPRPSVSDEVPAYFAGPTETTDGPDDAVDETDPPKYVPGPEEPLAGGSPVVPFRFRETPELAARKTAARIEQRPSGAPPAPVKSPYAGQRRVVYAAPVRRPVQRIVVHDISRGQQTNDQQEVPEEEQIVQAPPKQEVKGIKAPPTQQQEVKGSRKGAPPPPAAPRPTSPPPTKGFKSPSKTNQEPEVKGVRAPQPSGTKGKRPPPPAAPKPTPSPAQEQEQQPQQEESGYKAPTQQQEAKGGRKGAPPPPAAPRPKRPPPPVQEQEQQEAPTQQQEAKGGRKGAPPPPTKGFQAPSKTNQEQGVKGIRSPPPSETKSRRPPAPTATKSPPPPPPQEQQQEVKGIRAPPPPQVKGRRPVQEQAYKGQEQQPSQDGVKGQRVRDFTVRPPRIRQPGPSKPRTVFYPNVDEIRVEGTGYGYPIGSGHSASSQVIFPRRLTNPFEVHVREAVAPAAVVAEGGESAEADFLGLPIGSTKILGEKIDTSFDCTGKTYGYYADIRNGCKVYHVCSPKVDDFGVKFYEHFSFICAEGLLFDQQKLTCVPSKESSISCVDSEKYFQRSAAKFHEEHERFVNRQKVTPSPVPSVPEQPTNVVVGRAVEDVQVQPVVYRVSSVDSVAEEPEVGSYSYSYSKKSFSSSGSSGYSSPANRYKSKVHEQSKVSQQEQVRDQQEEQQEYEQPQRHVLVQDVSALQDEVQGSNNDQQQYEEQQPQRPKPPRRGYYPRPHHYVPVDVSPVGPSVQRISHNPSISMYVGQPGVGPVSRGISHNPSITQYISQPGVPSTSAFISHNPSISQYIPGPGGVGPSDEVISHNPSISHYVGGSEPVPPSGQTISHNPSIHQVIVRPDYSRPSARWSYGRA